MRFLKAAGPATINGLASYAGIVIVLFFVDVLLALVNLRAIFARVVWDPAGPENALTLRGLFGILAGLGVAVATLAASARSARRPT